MFQFDDDLAFEDFESLVNVLFGCECLARQFKNELWWGYYWAILEHFRRARTEVAIRQIAGGIIEDLERQQRKVEVARWN